MTLRVRFAPSPTGYLHIGGVRTALFNYLLARKESGHFLLRIEDTDRERSKPEFEDEIIHSLKWLGLSWDEPFFRQSSRLDRYQSSIDELMKQGLAYQIEEAGKFAVKLKVPNQAVSFKDLVHGPVQFESGFTEDFIIQKSDGFPTYHFACVIDDHDMSITHVIRGDDHLSNTPKQILIYRSFGWKPPEFGHLPLVFGSDKTPLSKRHGAVSLTGYRKEGYLAEALLNYLALLGWSPKNNQEIFTLGDLTAQFSLKQINTTNACFDCEKLKWINSEHIRKLSDSDYVAGLKEFFTPDLIVDHPRFREIALLYKGRLKTYLEFKELSDFFFSEAVSFDSKAVQKHLSTEETKKSLQAWFEILKAKGDFSSPQVLETLLRQTAEQLNIQAGELIHPTRVALSGRSVTPGIFEVMCLLGQEAVLERLEYVIIHFGRLFHSY